MPLFNYNYGLLIINNQPYTDNTGESHLEAALAWVTKVSTGRISTEIS